MRELLHRGFLCLVTLAMVIAAPQVQARPPQGDFAVVLLPDTQFYSESFPQTYLGQTAWIRSYASAGKVKFVIHLGDIVQHFDAEAEWRNAHRAHCLLDGVVPYSVLPGNHDMDENLDAPLYHEYFPPARFQHHAWYGGGMDGTNANNYCLFRACGMPFMVLSLAFKPSDEALQWAGEVIRSHPDHRVIVATHTYMTPNGRNGPGERIWNQLIRRHENVFLVLSGHVLGVAHQTSVNDAGRQVHEILCDYQGLPHGGDGWLQILYFRPREHRIEVVAYSPLLGRFNEEPEHTYALPYDMSSPSTEYSTGRSYRIRGKRRLPRLLGGGGRPSAGRRAGLLRRVAGRRS